MNVTFMLEGLGLPADHADAAALIQVAQRSMWDMVGSADCSPHQASKLRHLIRQQYQGLEAKKAKDGNYIRKCSCGGTSYVVGQIPSGAAPDGTQGGGFTNNYFLMRCKGCDAATLVPMVD